MVVGVEDIEDAPAADVAQVAHGRRDDAGRHTFADGSLAIRLNQIYESRKVVYS